MPRPFNGSIQRETPQWVLDNWMSEGKDTWLNAEQALKEGLVHEIYDGVIKKPPSAAYSQEEQAAYYDSHLIQEEPGTHEPQGLGEPITNHDMDKNKIIVLFAQAGIPLGEQVSALYGGHVFLWRTCSRRYRA